MKPGDLVAIRDEWRTLGIYYGLGVVTMMDEGKGGDMCWSTGPWKSFRVQWNNDFSWHDPKELELISENR